MEQTPPLPVAKSFLVCREVFQDKRTEQYILVGPLSTLVVPQVPAIVSVGAYAELTCCRGSYTPSVQLRDLEDQVVWSFSYNKPFLDPDPLGMVRLGLFRLDLCVTRLGKYDFVLLFNQEEVARRPLWVNLPPRPPV